MRWVMERQGDVKSLESEMVVGLVNAEWGCVDRQQNLLFAIDVLHHLQQ